MVETTFISISGLVLEQVITFFYLTKKWPFRKIKISNQAELRNKVNCKLIVILECFSVFWECVHGVEHFYGYQHREGECGCFDLPLMEILARVCVERECLRASCGRRDFEAFPMKSIAPNEIAVNISQGCDRLGSSLCPWSCCVCTIWWILPPLLLPHTYQSPVGKIIHYQSRVRTRCNVKLEVLDRGCCRSFGPSFGLVRSLKLACSSCCCADSPDKVLKRVIPCHSRFSWEYASLRC